MVFAYGFFFKRKQIDFGVRQVGKTKRLVEYQAAPKTIATAISSRLATLNELDTVYGVQDLWTLLEIYAIDQHNAAQLN